MITNYFTAITNAMGHLFWLLFTALICFVIYQLIHFCLFILRRREILTDSIFRITRGIVKFTTLIAFFLIALQYLGVSIAALWATVSGLFALVAIGFFAFWSLLSNVFCTLVLLVNKPFNVGDVITVIEPTNPDKTVKGKVININLFHTVLATLEKGTSNSEILIPNNYFLQKYIGRKRGNETFTLDEQLFNPISLLKLGKRNTKKKKAGLPEKEN